MDSMYQGLLLGCDFSSSPSPRKCILIALGRLIGGRMQLSELERISNLEDFSDWLGKRRSNQL